MKSLQTALITLLALLGTQAAHAASAGQQGSGLSGLCSYTPVTTPLDQGACWPLNVNGVTKTVTAAQFFKNAMQGPGTSTIGDAPIFSNTGGTAVIDAGAPPTLLAQDMAALAAMPVAPLALGLKVRVGTYSVVNRQFSPPVDYFLTNTACTPDGGSCMQSTNNSSYYWRITPQSVWDPRWWGAYGDTSKLTKNVATSSGSCTVVVTGGTFTATDVGKLITFTNIGSGGGTYNGPSYEGAIAGWVSASQITVSPCVGFTVNDTENVYYGHDDGAPQTNQPTGPINAAIQYMGALLQAQNLTGQPQLNGGGLSYGTTFQILVGPQHGGTPPVANGFQISNIDLAALGSANLPITHIVGAQPVGTGVMNINCSFCTGSHVHVDASYLPVNACVASSNGTIYWNDLRCNNWMGEGPSVVATGASSGNASQFTGQVGACSGTGPYNCILTVTALTTGKIQPGQGLSDCVGGSGNNCNVSVPNGTYIDGFKSGSGGVGTYSITNSTTNPGVISSETMYGLSLNVTVASCNSDNGSTILGNNWPLNSGGTLLVGRGEISRGNEALGVADRTFIVGCKDATTVVLNKAPMFNMSNKSLTFYQEPNGFYMNGTAIGSNFITGLQLTNLTISEDSLDYVQNLNTKFGCALFDDSGGGTTIDKGAIAYGAAQICFGADHHNTLINHMVTVSGAVGSVNEINQPAAVSFDGSDNIILNQFEFGGQLQFFAVNAGAFANKTISITNPVVFANLARTNLAPNNTIWFYSGQTAAPSSHINIGVASQNYNNPGAVNYVTFTSSAQGGWEGFTPSQIADFSQLNNVNIALFEQATAFPGAGITTAGGPASIEAPYFLLTGNYTLQETDSGTFFDAVGVGNVDITIPASLSASAVDTLPNPSAWYARIFQRTASTIRVVPASGVTIWQAGASTTSAVTLVQNFEYSLDCPRNTGGTTAICFLSKNAN